jgi:hypothetical protein
MGYLKEDIESVASKEKEEVESVESKEKEDPYDFDQDMAAGEEPPQESSDKEMLKTKI